MEQRGRRSVVASGKTIEDAIANGLAMLSVRRDEVDIEVLNPGSRGLLGIGAEDARVQLLVKLPPAPPAPAPGPIVSTARAPVPQVPPDLVAPKQVKPEPVAPRPVAPAYTAPEQVVTEGEAAEAGPVGREILAELLSRMGFHASVEVVTGDELSEEGQPPPLVLNIKGDDLGILIGRRGETLSDLQYLLRLMISHQMKHWTDLVVDVESYRVRRRRALESLSSRVAERVAATGRSEAMEPMPAYERRLVHMALRHHPQVTTQSVGVGEKRKVTVIPRK